MKILEEKSDCDVFYDYPSNNPPHIYIVSSLNVTRNLFFTNFQLSKKDPIFFIIFNFYFEGILKRDFVAE